jgi:hypothetical protein
VTKIIKYEFRSKLFKRSFSKIMVAVNKKGNPDLKPDCLHTAKSQK